MRYLFAIILFLIATLVPAQALRQVGTSTHPIAFLMVKSSDHVSPTTGTTPTVTVSKDGGAFGAPYGAVSELGSGWYLLAGNATDRNTLGAFLVHATGTGCDPSDVRLEIVGFDPFSALALDSTVAKDATVAKDSTVAKDATVAKDTTVAKDATVAKPGSAMTLTSAYDAAKSAAAPGAAMTLAANQHVIADTVNDKTGYSGTATNMVSLSGLATEVNATANRAAVIAAMPTVPTTADIWGYVSRSLTDKAGFAPTTADIWTYSTRTLSSYGTLVADVWGYATRTLTAGTNLNIPAAAPTVNEILAGAVDGSVDLKTALRRMLAAVYNSAAISGTGDKTIQLKASDGATNAGQQVIKSDGSGRVTTPQ